jgi:Ala-tRNA(Pro) deacylase
MGISPTLGHYLDQVHVHFDVVDHAHTTNSEDTARTARVAVNRVAKGVVLRDRRNGRRMMAVIPAANRINFKWLREEFDLDAELVEEPLLGELFPDCEPGAVPPVGQAFHLTTLWDESLNWVPEVYLEAGDHEHLLHLRQGAFSQVFEGMPHGLFSSEH